MDIGIIKKINILTVAEHLGITLERSGDIYKALCPFHTEKTPSFTVYGDTNSFYCFGCEEGGSNIDLVMKKNNYSLAEALDWFRTTLGTGEEEDNDIKLKLGGTKTFSHKTIDVRLVRYWHDLLYHTNQEGMFKKRGFFDTTIKELGFGWNGQRYTIPVWSGSPWISPCVGVRLRATETDIGPKYIGKKGYNKVTMYNRHSTVNSDYMFVFAGELDAALCYQDGLPAVSLVNGMTAFNQFPKNWAHLWFPRVKFAIIVFDREEAHKGGRVAYQWESQKGRNTSFVIHWPITPVDISNDICYNDYNSFRLCKGNTVRTFIEEVCLEQFGGSLLGNFT